MRCFARRSSNIWTAKTRSWPTRPDGLSNASSALDFIDAALGGDIAALRVAGVDMADARRAARGRIEVEVEHAIGAGELQLGALAFLDLQTRPAEMLDQLSGRHAVERTVIVLAGGGRSGS